MKEFKVNISNVKMDVMGHFQCAMNNFDMRPEQYARDIEQHPRFNELMQKFTAEVVKSVIRNTTFHEITADIMNCTLDIGWSEKDKS